LMLQRMLAASAGDRHRSCRLESCAGTLVRLPD
jgi:hypothetical protein